MCMALWGGIYMSMAHKNNEELERLNEKEE